MMHVTSPRLHTQGRQASPPTPEREASKEHSTPTTDTRREQHPLWLSVILHLLPGAALTGFVIALNALFGIEPLLGLLVGILVVIAPIELGYLAWHARRTTGSWSPLAAVDYTVRLPWKRLMATAVALAAWMVALVTISMIFLDQWLATTVFAWLPDAIATMATVTVDGEPVATGVLVAFLALFFISNGLVGPVTEELYFRGHLLPRIDRYGRTAPVINTALFTLYHFHSPWRYPVIFLGYLPICFATWRKRSLWIGLAAHMIINNVFVLIFLANYLGSTR